MAAGLGGDELSGGDQTFFVGEADGFAGADGFVGGFQAGDADDGADYEIDFGMGGDADGAGGAVDDFDVAEALRLSGACGGYRRRVLWRPRVHGLPAQGLFEGGVEVGSGGEGGDLEAVGVGFDHTQSAAADGAGRTQDGDASHGNI